MKLRDHIFNGLGSSFVFSMALGVGWISVRYFGLTWDTALLFQILWIVSITRWHQPSATLDTGEKHGA